MRLLALGIALISSSVFAQSAPVLECAEIAHNADAYIAKSDDLIHDQLEGVHPGNTMLYRDGIQIRNKIWQETLQDRFDIKSIAYLGNVPNCVKIANDVKQKVDAILRQYGLEIHEVGG